MISRKLRLRLRSLFSRSRVEQELDAELQYHLQRLLDDYVAAGLSPAEGQRRRELGVRMALGAGSGRVMVMVLREAIVLFGIALVIGIPTALGATRLLRGLVYDVPVTDTTTFVLAAVALGTTACIAALIPARRAATIDPASTIRLQ